MTDSDPAIDEDNVKDYSGKGIDELSDFWRDCLDRLSSFSVNGPEWKQINAFIFETEILKKKLEKQETKKNYTNWLEQKWNDLSSEFEEQVFLFGLINFNNMRLSSEIDFESVNETIQTLTDRLLEYNDLDKKNKMPSVTLAERRALRDRMTEVEDHIQNLNEMLESFVDTSQSEQQKKNLDDTVGRREKDETGDTISGNEGQERDEKKSRDKKEKIVDKKNESTIEDYQETIGNSVSENEMIDSSVVEEEKKHDDTDDKNAKAVKAIYIGQEDSYQEIQYDVDDELDDKSEIASLKNVTQEYPGAILSGCQGDEWSSMKASKMAARCLKNSDEHQADSYNEIILKLVIQGRDSLALQICRCQDQLNPDLEYKLHPWLIECHILNQHVLTADGQIQTFLLERFSNFNQNLFHPKDEDWNHLMRFFALSSSLRSALIAPLTGAADVIRQIHLKKGLQELYQLTQSVAKFPIPLDLIAIKKVQDKSAWDTEIQDLQTETKRWFEYAPQLTTCFSQATKVWRKWLERGNEVQSLLDPVIRNDPKYLPKVKGKLGELCDRTVVSAKMEQTRFELIKIKRKSGKIVSRAQNQFHKHLNNAIVLAKKWVQLQENNPNEEMNYALSEAYKLKDDLIRRKEFVLNELSEISDNHCTIGVQAGCSLLRAALEDLYRLFDPQCALPPEVQDPFQLFNKELLKTPIALLDEDWEPQKPYDKKMLDALLVLTADESRTFPAAFNEQQKAQNHRATGQILELMRADPIEKDQIENLSAKRENGIKECRDALDRNIKQTVKAIESALSFGFLNESERNELIADINGIEDRINEIFVFGEANLRLDIIRDQLEEKRSTKVKEAKSRLTGLRLDSDSKSFKRIAQALDAGDVLTANEYIDMVDRGESLPKEFVEKSYFTDFFIEKIQDIEDFFKDNYRGDNEIIKKVRNRSDICGLDMRRASKDQAVDTAEMLKAWFSAKRKRNIEVEKLHTIFRGLGFGIEKAEVVRKGKRPVFQIQTVPIRDRNLCPVPAFGSGANGFYRILCVWDRPSEEDLINEIGETLGNLPILVLYFGRVFLMRRRRFPRICRERRRTLLLLDDTLLLYLAAEREARLRAFFECTLPFTVTEPYTITAGLVPPEMFYGRRREREEIVKTSGSCFIYGGRQLGKTALLRDIVREFHMPAEGKHAIWIDLKTEGIGLHRPIDDIWETLIKELKNLDIIPSKVPLHTGWERITDHIEHWLEGKSERRIIFLLDEADLFLKSDADEKFSRVDQLKGLMDKTNRRFKVVFAGLHDVLRTTNQPNQALAHYGEPICIGPLLNDGEWREARSLVEKPLAALGYRFESPDLVTRILSRTNYYPSLIQLYCHQLLKHLSNPHEVLFDPENTPPYSITSFHVDDAYQSQELRKAIRDRFIWTLDLDPRYRLIAFAIANYCYENWNGAFEKWFEVEIIKDQSLSWWAKGFQQTRSTGDFKVLLDEMVGLGVLRKKEDRDFYALRSPNVVSMIGTEEEIQNELLK